MIIQEKTIEEARKAIDKAFAKKNKNEIIIVQARDAEFNRKILENKKISVLLSPELEGKDKLKERGSGLNEILCDIAAKNKIKIGINLNEITNKEPREKAILLSRIRQNIKLCKKSKTEIEILDKSEHDKRDILSLLMSLGADTKLAKEAAEN